MVSALICCLFCVCGSWVGHTFRSRSPDSHQSPLFREACFEWVKKCFTRFNDIFSRLERVLRESMRRKRLVAFRHEVCGRHLISLANQMVSRKWAMGTKDRVERKIERERIVTQNVQFVHLPGKRAEQLIAYFGHSFIADIQQEQPTTRRSHWRLK